MEFCIALQAAVFLLATFVTASLDLIIIAVSSNLYEPGTRRTVAKCCVGIPFFLQDKRRSCLRDRFNPKSFDMHGIIGRRRHIRSGGLAESYNRSSRSDMRLATLYDVCLYNGFNAKLHKCSGLLRGDPNQQPDL
jgi:hypothetical protein